MEQVKIETVVCAACNKPFERDVTQTFRKQCFPCYKASKSEADSFKQKATEMAKTIDMKTGEERHQQVRCVSNVSLSKFQEEVNNLMKQHKVFATQTHFDNGVFVAVLYYYE